VDNKRYRVNQILQKHRGRVYRHALRTLGNQAEAEDLTQEVLLSVSLNIDRFRSDSEIGTWIYRITANKCVDLHRKERGEEISLEELDEDQEPIDDEINPQEQRLKREANAELDRCIAKLPANQGHAVTLRYYHDQSYEEIAGILGIPEGTVGILLHRGRLLLGSMMTGIDRREKSR
jgi:RNA polymerase sigma factor (sigma-70 family)